jgi:hypothetical protein
VVDTSVNIAAAVLTFVAVATLVGWIFGWL